MGTLLKGIGFVIAGLLAAGGLVWSYYDNRAFFHAVLPGCGSLAILFLLASVDSLRCWLWGVPLSDMVELDDTPQRLRFRNKKDQPWQHALLGAIVGGLLASLPGLLAWKMGSAWMPGLELSLGLWAGIAGLLAAWMYLKRSAQWRDGHFDYVLDRSAQTFTFPFTPVGNLAPNSRMHVAMRDALNLMYVKGDGARMHAIFLVDAAGHTWFLRDASTREHALLFIAWLGEVLDLPVEGVGAALPQA